MGWKTLGIAMVFGWALGLGSGPSWAESDAPVALDDQALADIDGGFAQWNSVGSHLLGAKQHVVGSLHTAKQRTIGSLIDAKHTAINTVHGVKNRFSWHSTPE